ncbi:MAG: mechanosensitive ion channel family protein [Spirochaetaceae bacterium]|jgi:small-conductance mechanosensitive channel|nr:mechanosensitive ion channel family protein [Spirochaetaceae bacterium]
MKTKAYFFGIAALLLLLPLAPAQEAGPFPPPPGETASAAAGPAAEPAGEAGSLAEAVEAAGQELEEAVEELEEAAGRFPGSGFWRRILGALAILIVQILVIWFIWHFLYGKINKKVIGWGAYHIKPLTIKKLKILTVAQILSVVTFLLRILKYLVTAFLLFITLPVIFSLFPQTRHIANQLFGYILNPLRRIFLGAISYVPNLITIVIIIWVMRYILRGLKFLAGQVERQRLVIPGFYPDWSKPTYKLLRILVYAFTMVMIYPYLPGSGSPIFQGVSVFAGIILSLGSSSAIGNIIAGLVITYMRPFKIGDRIQIGNVTGFVEEKSLIVIKLRTHKNEYVTFPNTMILSSSITNYSTSTDTEKKGLIIHADVTMNYQVPWRKVEEIMINAAVKTPGIESEPPPWVLQTALEDFYARYQINACTRDTDSVPAIYADLYRNLQDGFADEGIDLTAPIYRINLPTESHKPPEKKPPPEAGA